MKWLRRLILKCFGILELQRCVDIQAADIANQRSQIKILITKISELEQLIISRSEVILQAVYDTKPPSKPDHQALVPINTRRVPMRQHLQELERQDHERFVAERKRYWEEKGGTLV